MRRFLFLDPSAELPVKCVGTKGIDLSRKESRGEDSVDHGPDLSKARLQRQPASGHSPPPAPPAKRENLLRERAGRPVLLLPPSHQLPTLALRSRGGRQARRTAGGRQPAPDLPQGQLGNGNEEPGGVARQGGADGTCCIMQAKYPTTIVTELRRWIAPDLGPPTGVITYASDCSPEELDDYERLIGQISISQLPNSTPEQHLFKK